MTPDTCEKLPAPYLLILADGRNNVCQHVNERHGKLQSKKSEWKVPRWSQSNIRISSSLIESIVLPLIIFRFRTGFIYCALTTPDPKSELQQDFRTELEHKRLYLKYSFHHDAMIVTSRRPEILKQPYLISNEIPSTYLALNTKAI